MRICIYGDSFAPTTFRKVWPRLGFELVPMEEAELFFFSQDTAIDPQGNREQKSLIEPIKAIYSKIHVPLVLTSQVTPGFTRALNIPIYHMAETLRIKDAETRALKPDYFVIGCNDRSVLLPTSLQDFFHAFKTPYLKVTYEEAEFSKIAVNMTLASQVDNATRLSRAAHSLGIDWERVAEILTYDKRIGAESYMKPGRWQDSQHLLRDYVTLKEIENG